MVLQYHYPMLLTASTNAWYESHIYAIFTTLPMLRSKNKNEIVSKQANISLPSSVWMNCISIMTIHLQCNKIFKKIKQQKVSIWILCTYEEEILRVIKNLKHLLTFLFKWKPSLLWLPPQVDNGKNNHNFVNFNSSNGQIKVKTRSPCLHSRSLRFEDKRSPKRTAKSLQNSSEHTQ